MYSRYIELEWSSIIIAGEHVTHYKIPEHHHMHTRAHVSLNVKLKLEDYTQE